MNLSQTPPGGWVFHQPQTGWWAPHPVGHTHDQQVQNIIKHRLANPAITAKHKLSTDFAAVSAELVRYQQGRGALPADVPPKLTPPLSTPQLSGAVREAVAVVKKMATGAALLMQWEEEGMPHVEQAQADSRAATCAKCPKNDKGKSLTEIFTVPVANMIKKKMERLDGLNLHTPHDSELKVCQACLCPMRTKVWMPTELVLKRLKPDQKAELQQDNPVCWILQESQSFTQSSAEVQSPPIMSPV